MKSEHRPSRFDSIACLFLASGIAIVPLGCGSRSDVAFKNAGQENKQDTTADALRRLETDSSPSTSLEVLQGIDSASNSSDDRPVPSPEKIAAIAALFQMDPAEAETIAGKQFNSLDADYLSSCLLFRDAVRALEINEYSAEERALLGFAWVCRQIYLSDQYYPIAPPWWVAEAGSGNGYDRACVFLEVVRQLHLDGCLIGPPELAELPSQVAGHKTSETRFATIRAVGVRIESDILLFDPWQGKPVLGDDGKTIATLAQARTKPEGIRDWLASGSVTAGEAKRWEVFLAPPIAAVSPRLEWLQRQMRSSNPLASDSVALYVDAPALLERFKEKAMAGDALKTVNCRYWNPPDLSSPGANRDPYSPSRIQLHYQRDLKAPDGSSVNRSVEFSRSHFPRQFIPILQVDGKALGGRPQDFVNFAFGIQFKDVLFAPDSPRDHLLHGQYNTAAAALTVLKEKNDNEYQGLSPEKSLQGVVKEWALLANEVFADTQRAKESRDAGALAKAQAAENQFRNAPLTMKIDHIVRRKTTRLLSAEAAYQLALVFHEKAERSQAHFDRSSNDERQRGVGAVWIDAAGKWNEYLSNYPDLREFYSDRNSHAKRLLSRCEEFSNKSRPPKP